MSPTGVTDSENSGVNSPGSGNPNELIAIEVQLPDALFLQFQSALDRYPQHSASSLATQAIAAYLKFVKILETSEPHDQLVQLVDLIEMFGLLFLRPEPGSHSD